MVLHCVTYATRINFGRFCPQSIVTLVFESVPTSRCAMRDTCAQFSRVILPSLDSFNHTMVGQEQSKRINNHQLNLSNKGPNQPFLNEVIRKSKVIEIDINYQKYKKIKEIQNFKYQKNL